MADAFLSVLLALLLPFASLDSSVSDQQQIGCGDASYAFNHPVECGLLLDPCLDAGYAGSHASECGVEVLPPGSGGDSTAGGGSGSSGAIDSGAGSGGSGSGSEAVESEVGCGDASYAFNHPVECGTELGCGDASYAFNHPVECGVQVDAPPTAAITVTQNAIPGSSIKVSVSGSDDVDVDQLILYDGNGVQVDSFACPSGVQNECRNDFAVTVPSTHNTAYAYKAKAKDSAGQLSDFAVASGVTTPAPVCAPGSERWGATPESMPSNTCPAGWDTHAKCNGAGQWVLVECIQPTEEPSVSPAPLDASPSVLIAVPPSAAPGAALAITVTATDDVDVAQLLLLDSAGVQIASFDCLGVQTVCSNVFAAAAPATPATAYTFKAQGKDNTGKLSAFVSGSGVTTAAPVVPPVVPPVIPPVVPPVAPPVSAAPVPLDVVSVSFPLQPLFMRSVGFADSDCMKPGESAILAVKVQNKGREVLKDVRFTASVPELGIYASDGPVKLTAKDKSTRFLQVDVPEDAENGAYMLRFTVSNNKFKRSVHRDFVVGSNC